MPQNILAYRADLPLREGSYKWFGGKGGNGVCGRDESLFKFTCARLPWQPVLLNLARSTEE